MSERNEFPRTLSTAIPAIPIPAPSNEPATASEDEARLRIAALEREARAIGQTTAAALLFHEIGLLWESPLRHPRNAAVAYQSAFKLAPRFLANIRAARRLFAEVGNWVMVVQLLDAEYAATEGRRGLAALLFEKAQVLEQRLSREADALVAIGQCLAHDPEDVTLLVQLEQVFAEKGDYASLVKVYRLMAQAVSDAGARAHYLTSAGLLLEDRLKDLGGAAVMFRAAFALDRRDPQLLSAMKRVAQREGTVDEELAALAAEAESQGPMAAPTFLQISRAYERLNRPDDALAALVAAQRVAPKDPLVLAELARIYETQGRYQELAEVLSVWGQTNNDESDFVSINLRLAAILEEHLKRDADAMGRYQTVLERVPGNSAALAGMGKLCYRMQNWQGLLDTYEAEAAATDDPRQKATRVYRAAEVLEERLNKVEEAIARYNECLQLSPGFLPAQKALTRFYEKLGRWPELIAMYEQDLAQTADREQQISTLNKIASIYEDRLGELQKAIDYLKRVLELSPDHLPTMRNLGRLYERSGQWGEILTLNEQESRLAGDTKQIVSLAHRNAEILEDQLKDRPAAIAAWERVLQLSPTYPPALRALGRLYGQDGRWDSLIKMYRAEAEIAPSTEQAANLIAKIGELYEQKVKNENEAIASYREVLTLAPSHASALRALARIYRSQGDWESLIEILHAEAANRTDPTERSNAMFQAACIWEDQLKKPERAIEGYQEVLRLAPTHTIALAQLERLLTGKDDVKELIVLLDRQSQVGAPASRVAAFVKLARLYLDRLNEPGRATNCCESALALEPNNLAALRLLERIRANDKPRRAELRSRIAQLWGDAKLAAAIRLSSLDGDALPSEESIQHIKAAYLATPSDEALGLMLERALQKVGDSRALVELYEHRRATASDPSDLLELSLRIADLQENQLGDLNKAVAAYETALQAAPDLYPALTGLARCFTKLNQPARTRQTLETIAQIGRDPTTVIHALIDAGHVARDLQKDDAGAIDLFRKVLDREPLNPDAGPALEDLLARRGGAGDLALLHEKRADAKMAQQELPEAASEYFQAARVYLETLHDRPAAYAAAERALAAAPAHPDALELKAMLALEAQNYAEAANAWAIRVQQGGDVQHVTELHLKLGALYHDHLKDETRASAHLQTVLASEPSNVEALERLAAIHTDARNWTGASDCLRRLLEVEPSLQARTRFTLALAKILDEGFDDVAQAIATYRKALELSPGEPTAIERLVTLYERIGNLGELVKMLEQQAQHAGQPKRALELKLRIAALYGKQLADPQRAIATYRQVTDLEPGNIGAHVAMAELYGRDTSSTAMAIETHRTLLRLEPARVESLHALFRMWDAAKNVDKAFCAASLLSFFRAANDVENAFCAEGRDKLPNDLKTALGPPDLQALHHPMARNALVDVFRAIGDQFVKLTPPQLEQQGIDKKADRLKNDNPVFKVIQAIAAVFGVQEFEAYQAKRGLVFLETTEPLSVLVGPDVVRRFKLREQRFLFGRAALGLLDKLAFVRKMSVGEITDVLGNSVRIHEPAFVGLGRRSEEQSKQLRKAYSRRALNNLKEPASAVAHLPPLNAEQTVQGLLFSADRAGLLVCADLAAGLNIMLREDGPVGAAKPETPEAIAAAVGQRVDLRELIPFAVSDDFFRLRQRLGVALA